MDLLNNLWSYALPKAKEEAAELQKLMDKEGKGEKLRHGTGGTIPKSYEKRNIICPKRRQSPILNWKMYVKVLLP